MTSKSFKIDTRRVRGNFSAHATSYDKYAAVQKRVVALLYEEFKKSDLQYGRYLDVGTGTGALAKEILSNLPDAEMYLMDIAHGMTKAASNKLSCASGCDGDAKRLPFKDQAFRYVLSSSVYQWVDCLPKAFHEVSRVLEPSGVFAFALFGEKTLHELRSSHQAAVASADIEKQSHIQKFPSQNDIFQALNCSGLRVDTLFSSAEVEYHKDVPDLLKQLKSIGASNANDQRPKGLRSRKIMTSMIENYEQRFRCELGLPASYEIIVGIATKQTF